MGKRILLLMLINCLFFQWAIAQYKIEIDKFFINDINRSVKFSIDVPFKVKVKRRAIKRSNSQGFFFYQFKPKKRKRGIEFYIGCSKNTLGYISEAYKDAGSAVEEQVDERGCVVFFSNP
jgi:hypothetical protein